jgi:hypothetical protein
MSKTGFGTYTVWLNYTRGANLAADILADLKEDEEYDVAFAGLAPGRSAVHTRLRKVPTRQERTALEKQCL